MDNARPSPQLLAANRRLQQLRAQAKRQAATGLDLAGSSEQTSSAPVSRNIQPGAASLPGAGPPSHLGWGSERLTQLLRRRQAEAGRRDDSSNDTSELTDADLPNLSSAGRPAAGAPIGTEDGDEVSRPPANDRESDDESHSEAAATVTLYPDIGLGMLRRGLTAPGRLWLLLRHLDREGQGVLRIDIIKQHLTNPSSTIYLCSSRHLRNLLRQGEGVFWQREKGRVWLRSAAKVADALDVERLTGRPAALPLAVLTGGIVDFRAHLYAAFHAGRGGHGGEEVGRPIARATLSRLSGVARRTLNGYEKRAGVKAQANYAVGERADSPEAQERAWQEGPALFTLRDRQGKQGPPQRVYLAWQLPNSYHSPLRRQPRGRQRRLNRQLADLRKKRGAGNGQVEIEPRRYYADGGQAGRAYNRDPQRDLYWPQREAGRRGRGGPGGGTWHTLAGREGK